MTSLTMRSEGGKTMSEKWYVVKCGEIVCTVDTEQEAIDYINSSPDDALEAYPEAARVDK